VLERAGIAEKSILNIGEPQPMLGEEAQQIAPPCVAE
jgi:hypothetical protein